MMKKNNLIRYLCTLAFLGILSGFALAIANTLFEQPLYRQSVSSCFEKSFLFIFITYSCYLLLNNLLKKYSLLIRGVFCLILQIILFLIPISLVGIDLPTLIDHVIAIGLFCFCIPYVDNYLYNKLNRVD